MNNLQRTGDAPPLHVQLAQIIKTRIDDGTWRDGDVIPTEKALCAEFDVARGTVRQALQSLEADGFLRREQGRGTFVTFRQQAAAITPRRQQIAFIVPYVRDSSVSTMFMGFQQVAEAASYTTAFSHVNNDVEQQARTIELLIEQGVSGIALYPVDSEIVGPLQHLVNTGFPVILVDRYLKHLSTDFVMSDHFGGAILGTRYLLDLGHERIGFATWLSPAVSMEHRHIGYVQALRERGIMPDPSLVCYVEGYPTIDLKPMKALLQQPGRPTAIFAANDQIAIALYRAAASIGLRVPDDLAVVGFDNLDLAEQLDPALTTIAQPFLKIGRTAAETLLKRIAGDHDSNQITLSPQLMERESCLPLAEMRAQLTL
ncbi:MAG: GntR family transcriptional regulator [Blastochloris sp.]|nr:GntR family transcriptional regulator [Blastochloris sp.]